MKDWRRKGILTVVLVSVVTLNLILSVDGRPQGDEETTPAAGIDTAGAGGAAAGGGGDHEKALAPEKERKGTGSSAGLVRPAFGMNGMAGGPVSGFQGMPGGPQMMGGQMGGRIPLPPGLPSFPHFPFPPFPPMGMHPRFGVPQFPFQPPFSHFPGVPWNGGGRIPLG